MPRLGLYSSGWSRQETVQLGASDFWRVAVPARELAGHGWDVVAGVQIQAATDGTLILKDEDGVLHDDCDVVLWQRWMGTGAVEAIRRARSVGQVVVQDVDDMYWALPRSAVAHRETDPRRNPGYNREIYREILKASTLITVSTPFLSRALGRWGPPVRVVRNYVALDLWKPRPPGPHVGWVGAIPWRGADLSILRQSVVPWLRERGRPFYHGGDMADADRSQTAAYQLGYPNVTTRLGCPLPQYPSLWGPLGVALAPIELSTFGTAKSWAKGLEACARGIPVIATDHPEYRELGVARLAKRPRDWTRHLDELQDPEVHARECAANRRRAEELSIERNWRAWDDVLREALSLRDDRSGVRVHVPA